MLESCSDLKTLISKDNNMENSFDLVCKLTAENACKLVDEARDSFKQILLQVEIDSILQKVENYAKNGLNCAKLDDKPTDICRDFLNDNGYVFILADETEPKCYYIVWAPKKKDE